MKDIKVKVGLDNKDEFRKELEGLGKNLKIDIDLTKTNDTLQKLLNNLMALNDRFKEFTEGFKGVKAQASGANKELKETNSELKKMDGQAIRVKISTDMHGNKKEITDYRNSLSETARQIELNGKVINESFTTEIEKAQKRIGWLRDSLETLENAGVKVGDLKRSFNVINREGIDTDIERVEKLEEKILELLKSLNSLSSFKVRSLEKLDKLEINGQLDTKEVERLKGILDKVNARNLQEGMSKFNHELNLSVKSAKDLQGNINDTEKEIQRLQNAIDSAFKLSDKTGNSSIIDTESFVKVQDELENLQWKLNALKTVGKDVDVDELRASINEAENAVKSLNAELKGSSSEYTKVQNAINTAMVKLEAMSDIKLFDDAVIKSWKDRFDDLGSEIDTTSDAFRTAMGEFKNFTDTGSKIKVVRDHMEKLNAQLARAEEYDITEGMEVERVRQSINKLNNALEEMKKTGKSVDLSRMLADAKTDADALRNSINKCARETKEFKGTLSSAFSALGLTLDVGDILRGVVQGFKQGIEVVQEFDSAMRDLRKVTDATDEELEKFGSTASEVAIEVGNTTTNVIKATEYYSKLGYAIDEASERAKNAAIFKNIGDFSSIEDASEALITIEKGFDLSTVQDMVHIMDVANEVGNNFSSSTQDIAKGLQRMGNVMHEAGNTYEQTVGLFVSANASIQDAESVGNAIKTITMRLRGMETEIDETSVPVSKLRDEIMQLTSTTGHMIDIMADDNTFRSTYDILTELAQVYPLLEDGQRAYLQYVIAGQRQGNVLSGMLSNMSEGVNAYNTALHSTGSAYREQEIYMDSVEGRANQLKETMVALWVDFINTDNLKKDITIVTNLLSGLGNGLVALADFVGVTGVAILLLSNILAYKFGKQIKVYIASIYKTIVAEGLWAGTTTVLKKVWDKFTLALTNNPLMALVMAITAVVTALALFKKKAEEAKEAQREMNKEFVEEGLDKTIDSAEDLISKYEELEGELKTLQEGTEEYNAKEAELQETISQLTGLYPSLNEQISNNEGKKRLNIDATKELIESEKELAKIKAMDILGENKIGGLGDIEDLIDKTLKLKDGIAQANESREEYFKEHKNANYLSETLNKDKQAFEDNIDVMKAVYSAYQIMNDGSEEHRAILETLGQGLREVGYEMEDFKDEVGDTENTLQDASKEVKHFWQGFNDWNLDGSLDEADEKIMAIMDSAQTAKDAVDALIDSFKSYKTPIELMGQAIEQLQQNGSIDGELYEKMVEQGGSVAAGLWLKGADALEYYTEKHAILQQEAEETSNAIIAMSAKEEGIMEQNQEAYAIWMDERKQQAIATAEAERDEKIRIAQQEVDNIFRYREQHAVTQAEKDELQLQKAEELQRRLTEIEQDASTKIENIKNGLTDVTVDESEAQISTVEQQVQREKDAYQDSADKYEETTLQKTKYEQAFLNDSVRRYDKFVGDANTRYKTDTDNFKTQVNEKKRALSELQTALNNTANIIDNFNNKGIVGSGSGRPRYTMESQSLADEFDAVAPMSSDVVAMGEDGEGGGFDVSPTAIPGGVQHSSGSFVGSTVGSYFGTLIEEVDALADSTDNLTESTKKNIDATSDSNSELKIEYDRYYRLNDVIKDYDNLLEAVTDAKESADSKESIKYERQELEIIARKIQALKQLQREQEKEYNEVQSKLKAQGFLFDSYGNLINSQERLQDLADWANEGDDERKDHVRDIEDMVSTYTDLANNAIPDTKDSIRDLNKELKDRAVDDIESMRDKLVDALRDERESQKETELNALDKRRDAIQRQIDALEDSEENAYDRKARLEAELEKWRKDDSALSIKRQQEILAQLDEVNQEIQKNALELELAKLDEEEKAIEDSYDKILEDKQLYEDANQLLTSDNMDEMLRLLQTYGQDYTDIGLLYGKNLSDAFLEEIKLAMDALDFLKGETEKYTNNVNPNKEPDPPKTTTPSPQPTTTTQPKAVTMGGKVKVTDPNASIYVDSYTSSSSGTWKGAGVSASDTMYVYNMNNGKVALSRTKGGVPIGWIDKKKVMAFDTGGYTGNFEGGKLAMLHSKERVLSAQQTQSFEKLISMLDELVQIPMLQMSKMFKSFENPMQTNVNTVTINNDFSITNNTPFDLERQDDNLTKLMERELRKFGKITKK